MNVTVYLWCFKATGKHVFPSRTESLSPPAPMILPRLWLGKWASASLSQQPPVHRMEVFVFEKNQAYPKAAWHIVVLS